MKLVVNPHSLFTLTGEKMTHRQMYVFFRLLLVVPLLFLSAHNIY